MITRLLSSIIMVAVALFALFKGGILLLVGLGISGAVMAWEITRAGTTNKWLQVIAPFSVFVIFYALWQVWMLGIWYAPWMLAILLVFYGVSLWELWRKNLVLPKSLLALFLRAVIIPAFGLSFAYIIRENYGIWFSLLFFSAIWGSDIAALIGGRAIGKTMLTDISPNKTVEGSFSGTVGAMALSVGLASGVGIGFNLAVMSGFGVSVLAQIGDLHESLFKRRCGIKDSSAIIPGHGGVYDRLDSTVFSAPAYYYLLGLIV